MEKGSYLEKLKYDKKLGKQPIAKYLTNFRFVLLLIITIIALGVFAFFNLPRRLNPEVKIPVVLTTTILPGAGPEEIEKLVTIPVEDAIAGIEGVNTIASNSQENSSIITVEFEEGIDPDHARDQVASAVDSVSLPEEAQDPNVQKLDFENQPVWQFLLTTDRNSASLTQFAKELKEKIEDLATVKTVQINGLEEQEIQIEVKETLIEQFGLDTTKVSRSIQAGLKTIPAGNLKTESSNFSLTVDETIKTTDDIRNIAINVNSQIIRLGQVATVTQRSKPEDAKTFVATPTQKTQRAVSFSVFKTDAANINEAVEDVKEVTNQREKESNDRFKIISVINYGDLIDEQFTELAASFRDTIILVIIVLLVFLGVRQALIVAFTIPLSFLVAFTFMQATGISLNFLSLFSLILALGLLVDDAIVIVTATTAYWRTKKFTPQQTGLLVLRDFFVPIWSTTITAVWAFLPLLIATGIIGEFIKSMPIVVSTTLIASTAIAILITLPLMMIFLKPQFPNRVRILLTINLALLIMASIVAVSLNNPLLPVNMVVGAIIIALTFKFRREFARDITKLASRFFDVEKVKRSAKKIANSGIIDSQKYARKYQRLIETLLASKSAANKTLIIVIAFAVFSYALVPLGFVFNEFFPKTDENIIYVSVELPAGTNLQTSESEAKALLESLRGTQEVDYITAETSRTISQEDFFGPTTRQNNILLTLVLPDDKKRMKTSSQIAQELREEFKNYNKGKLSVIELTGGPPAGSDLQIKLKGENLETLDQYADKIVNYLQSQQTTTNAQKSITTGTSKIVFVPDGTKLANYGLTQDIVGTSLRSFASGFEIERDATINGEAQNIVLRNNSQIRNPHELSTVNINTLQGSVPLSALGEFVLKPNPTQITREDQRRTLSVSAGLAKGSVVQKENKKLEDFAKNLNLPSGYTWETGGVNEENQQSLTSIFQAMVIAMILITATMVLQFGSYRKAFIVLLKIPLAISGVFIVFALTGTPLSFPTVIGILALFGITVYQSMLIVDKIGKNTKAGMPLKAAIADACASRVEPILFGTITTVVGLIPITLSDPLWRGLGGAIIAGLLFSGVIMLLFIPVVYYKMFEKEIT